ASALHVRDAPSFRYLGGGNCFTCAAVKDDVDFESTHEAMRRIGFKPDETRDIWRVLAGILHLGNVQFSADSADAKKAVVATDDADAANAMRFAAEA
ncbi:hypothetical protein, partial [Klebsiella variicola]|uniref:hypothetical protein n=1 Tax=Klebsiella variicola TaxID=244366 RepID=UPI003450565E